MPTMIAAVVIVASLLNLHAVLAHLAGAFLHRVVLVGPGHDPVLGIAGFEVQVAAEDRLLRG